MILLFFKFHCNDKIDLQLFPIVFHSCRVSLNVNSVIPFAGSSRRRTLPREISKRRKITNARKRGEYKWEAKRVVREFVHVWVTQKESERDREFEGDGILICGGVRRTFSRGAEILIFAFPDKRIWVWIICIWGTHREQTVEASVLGVKSFFA